jgi:hypothetical protein
VVCVVAYGVLVVIFVVVLVVIELVATLRNVLALANALDEELVGLAQEHEVGSGVGVRAGWNIETTKISKRKAG